MTAPNRNAAWAGALFDELARAGVREVCLAPGSRSTPLVMACAGDARFRVYTHLDERSAGFFALGLAKASGRPAAMVTTSGTAAANLYPAVVEAAQAGVPLLVLTADRPHRLRDADANQSIDQLRLFGSYPRAFFEVAPPSVEDRALRHVRALACRAVGAAVGWPAGPVHLNLPFEKPLEPRPVAGDVPPGFEEAHPLASRGRDDGAPFTRVSSRRPAVPREEVDRLAGLLEGASRAVVVAGPAPEADAAGPAALAMAAAAGLPVLADPLSGARFAQSCGAARIGGYDLALRDAGIRQQLGPDLILRVGAMPTSAALARWLEEHASVRQVVVDGGGRWKDHLALASDYVQADPETLLRALAERVGSPSAGRAWRQRWERVEAAVWEAVAEDLEGPFFEGNVLAEAAAAVPPGGALFVSNSMPIRDLDTFARPREEVVRAFANRGASGIDGIVSTALGVAAAGSEPLVVVLGDLALYHDTNGLLAARKFELDAVFLLVHNDGGGIFHMLPIREHEPAFTPHFATPHGLDFRHAADLHGVPFERLDPAGPVGGALADALERGGARILEVRTDREENRIRHDEVAAAVAARVRQAL